MATTRENSCGGISLVVVGGELERLNKKKEKKKEKKKKKEKEKYIDTFQLNNEQMERQDHPRSPKQPSKLITKLNFRSLF